MTRLILASASPRRLEILRALGLRPETWKTDTDESPLPDETPSHLVERLATDKAVRALREIEARGWDDSSRSGAGVSPEPASCKRAAEATDRLVLLPVPESSNGPRAEPGMRPEPVECLVIGADTAVVLGREVFGKPADRIEAERFLSRLSGRTHEVLTGLTLIRATPRRVEAGVAVTRVAFASLSPAEITAYVASGEPLDKAGAYGIQAEGGRFVERIEGSYTNVVGLPVELFETLLARFGLRLADLVSGRA